MAASVTGKCLNPDCGNDLFGYEPECRACGTRAGYPNIRRALIEQGELDRRYREAILLLETNGQTQARERLEMLARSAAVIKAEYIAWTAYVFRREDLLFVSYQELIDAGVRLPADPDDDAKRLQADSSLYASYGSKILYAALSCTGRGAVSYGTSHVQFTEGFITNRTTVCEDNVYLLRERIGHTFGLLPKGYVAVLAERHKLAVVKNADLLRNDMDDDQLKSLILASNGDRGSDRMLEVHIYRPLSVDAVQTIRVFGDSLTPNDSRDLDTLTSLASTRRTPLEVKP